MTHKQKGTVKKIVLGLQFYRGRFMAVLTGKLEQGSFNRKWAVRLAIEGLNYYDLIELVGLKTIAEVWPEILDTFRIKSIKEGIDYVI